MQYDFIGLKFYKSNDFIFMIVDNQIEIKLQIFFQPFCIKHFGGEDIRGH